MKHAALKQRCLRLIKQHSAGSEPFHIKFTTNGSFRMSLDGPLTDTATEEREDHSGYKEPPD